MTELTPLFMDLSSVYSGDELGLPYRDLIGEGIVGVNDLKVSQRGAGANLSVDVAAGACWVLGDTNVAAQPCYRCRNDAIVNLGITPDPTNPRKVLVVAQITDETFSGTGRQWRLVAIHGTPAASPAEPALPVSALPLGLIDVTTGDIDITNAQVTDRRARAAVGGQVPAAGSSMQLIQTLVRATDGVITFTGIPNTYDHLKIIATVRSKQLVTTDDLFLRLHNDSAANYAWVNAKASGTAWAVSNSGGGVTYVKVGQITADSSAAGSYAGVEIDIYNANLAVPGAYRIVRSKAHENAGTVLSECSGSWGNNTSAVDQIDLGALLPAAGELKAGSRASLYGIKGV